MTDRMTIQQFISRATSPLSPTDTVEDALGTMMEHRVLHLPVVDDAGCLIGVMTSRLRPCSDRRLCLPGRIPTCST
jgi:CBS domain-containing protein